MANGTMAMNFLKENSIKVYIGMTSVFPQFSDAEIGLNVSDLAPKFDGCYAINKSTVSFVSGREFYVTPYTTFAITTLCNAGFQEKSFYVPFSNGEYPKEESEKWLNLREKARQLYAADFVEDCCAYCEKNNIGTLNHQTLKNCLKMPESGVKVRQKGTEKYYYPIINGTCFDSNAASYIGCFCVNNNVVVFVYRDGKTYVTKGTDIQQELIGAGYTKVDMFVPFSNGERILDPKLRACWRAITK